jgi:hypothetical protein
MQEDKSDKLNWNLVVQNWKTIDAALHAIKTGQYSASGRAVALITGSVSTISGEAETEETT